jgi:hypothetical protein
MNSRSLRSFGTRLGALFSDADSLAHLTAQAERLIRLQKTFETGVPPALCATCRVANIKNGKVVILTENGSAALKLKQLSPTLVLRFCAICPEVTEVEIRVQVATPVTKSTIFKPLRPALSAAAQTGLSAQTVGALRHLASALPGQSPLKDALLRLLSRSRCPDAQD